MLDSGQWTLDSGRCTLGIGHCCKLGDPHYDSAWSKYWKFFWCDSIRIWLSDLFCRVCSSIAIFRIFIWTLRVTLQKSTFIKILAIIINCIRSKAAMQNCSEVVVQSHPFSENFKENASGRVLLLEKLQIDSPEQPFYTKITTPIMFSWKSSDNFQNTSQLAIKCSTFKH